MNRVHHYQGLDSRQKSGQEATEPASTNNRFTRSLGKSRSSFNNSVSQSITSSIQKGKSYYLNQLEVYYNMHLIEILADEKIELLKKFKELFQEMVDQLKDLLFLIKQVDFEAPNFEELYQTDAEYFSETVYRDIKHLEQQHYDLIYSSSLRFLSNILECLSYNFEIDIYEFDIRNWAQQVDQEDHFVNPSVAVKDTANAYQICLKAIDKEDEQFSNQQQQPIICY